MQAAAARMAEALSQAIAECGQACAALSGGTTPGPAYEALAKHQLNWSKITFALVDERFVPPSDPGSNEGLVRRTLAPAFAQGARFVPMYSAAVNVSEAASAADAAYRDLSIDIALMGMGEDGHTASWFPSRAADALNPDNPCTVIAVHAEGARGASDRMTLTYNALTGARSRLLLITGDAKRAALEQSIDASPADRPVASLFVLSGPHTEVIWAA